MNSLQYSPASSTTTTSHHLHNHIHNPPTPTPSPSTLSSTTPLKRTRAKRSCDFCRKRKSRCDADHSIPCSNCRAWGYTCEFQTVRKKRGPPSVYVDNLEKRCKKMERLLVSLTQSSIKQLEQCDFQYDPRDHMPPPASPSAVSDSSSDDDDDDDDDDDNQANSTNSVHDITVTKDYDSIKYTGHSAGLQLVDHDIFKSKPFIRWPGRDDLVLKMMAQDELMIVRTSEGGNKVDTRLVDVGLSMRSAIFDQGRSHHHPASAAAGPTSKTPTKQMSDKMIGLFFTHLHPFLPIINESKFMQQYRTRSPSPPAVLVQAMLALSFRYAAQHFQEKEADQFADLYFRKVMKRLRDALRSRLCHVQAGLLMTLYLDMDDGAGHDVESVQWFTLGTAIRMAQDLGLHRSCQGWRLPPSEIEVRHRVFYACYVLDRWMGARAGKPLTILDRDFDTDMPSPYRVTDAGPTGEPVYRPFLLLIRLSEILGRVLKALYAPKAKRSNCNAGLDDPTILVVFDRRLKNWRASLDEAQDGVTIPPSQKAHLQVFYNTIVLLLHRPFIQLSPAQFPDLQSIVAESRKACTEAADNISAILRQHGSTTAGIEPNMALCLPTCFVYAMFQSSLVHLSNTLQDRASSQRQEALVQSLSLLQSHEHLCSAPRAIEIIQMLITVNELSTPSAPSNGHARNKRRSQMATATAATAPPPPLPSPEQPPQPVADEEYPKSNHVFEQRMVNCSVLGGITPDIRPDVAASIMGQHSNTPCFLPQPETAQLSMNFYHHHPEQYIAPQALQHNTYPPLPHHPLPPSTTTTTTTTAATTTTTASTFNAPLNASTTTTTTTPQHHHPSYPWTTDWSVFLGHPSTHDTTGLHIPPPHP